MVPSRASFAIVSYEAWGLVPFQITGFIGNSRLRVRQPGGHIHPLVLLIEVLDLGNYVPFHLPSGGM